MASKESDTVILRTSKDWPRWFANIHDQAKYDNVWEFVDPQATPSTGQKKVVTIPPEPFVKDEDSETSLRMQLEKYRRWEKKVKAIKSFDNHIIQTLGPHFSVFENCTNL